MRYLCPQVNAPTANSVIQGSEVEKDEKRINRRTIRLSTSFPDNVPTYRLYKALYQEGFRRMGYDFQIVYHPGLRSPLEVNSGTPYDACHAMGKHFIEKTGNLAAVQRQLGHTNPAYSMQFTRITYEELGML